MTLKRKFLVSLVLFFVTVAIRVPVLRSVGETWDEYTVVNPGETYISAIKNLDFSASPWIQNYEHPPVAKYLYGLSRVIPTHLEFVRAWDSEYHLNKEYTVPRLLSATFGGLTVVLVFLIGSALFGPAVGVVSALVLTVTPHFIAYTAIASLESPFIFFTTLFVYFLIRALKSNSWPDHLLTVVALTLSGATRYNGIFFVIFYAVMMWLKFRRKLPGLVLLSPLIFLGLFYALWPWLWLSPWHLVDSISRSTGGHSGEYFLGSLAQPNWFYYPLYFLVTTPEVSLVFLGGFIYLGFWKLAKQKLEVRFRNWKLDIRKNLNIKHLTSFPTSNFQLANLFLLAWFLTPFLATVSNFKQGGIRYIVAFMPALAVISGYMVIWLYGFIKERRLRTTFVSFVILGLIYPIVLFFPYYLDYYNLASGGPRQAYENKSLTLSWWGEGGLAAVRYINQNAPKNAVVRTDFSPAHVLIKFRSDLRVEQNFVLENKDDFILVNTYNERYTSPLMLQDLSQYQLVYEVSTPVWNLFSAPLVKVYRRI